MSQQRVWMTWRFVAYVLRQGRLRRDGCAWTKTAYGPLFATYNEANVFWEGVEVFKRLVFTSALVLLEGDAFDARETLDTAELRSWGGVALLMKHLKSRFEPIDVSSSAKAPAQSLRRAPVGRRRII